MFNNEKLRNELSLAHIALRAVNEHLEDLEKASCKTCKWLNDEVCTNGDSPMCADYPNTDMMCGYYEKR